MTMERILTALGEVIAERGAEKAGINAVADKAGVNKVLIYRYFGGYEGLMERFIQQGHFLSFFNDQFLESNADELTSENRSRVWTDYMVSLLRELKSRRSSQELIKWELANITSELSKKLADIRNDSLRKVVQQFAPHGSDDPAAITAVMLAGITHLGMLSAYNYKIIDIDLQSEEGWERIEKAIQTIYHGLDLTLREKTDAA